MALYCIQSTAKADEQMMIATIHRIPKSHTIHTHIKVSVVEYTREPAYTYTAIGDDAAIPEVVYIPCYPAWYGMVWSGMVWYGMVLARPRGSNATKR